MICEAILLGWNSSKSLIFSPVPINLIGHLEHLAIDWKNKIIPTYNLSGEFNPKFGTHPTSQNHPWIQIKKGLAKSKNTNVLILNPDAIIAKSDYAMLENYINNKGGI